ncbi:MAG: T9SS type A sorting domain-containing protein [bacterium]
MNYKLRPSGISDRDLLGLGNLTTRLTNLTLGHVKTNAVPDTLRILAILVEFQEDNNSLTTGNGKFELDTSSEKIIDPPPHDLMYFKHQLLALSNYYKKVSKGKLILEAEVFPKEPTDSYTLSQQMSFYSPTGSEELLDQRLSELFQEGFQLADASDNIDFAQFDSFILFHAGVGSDFALDFDPTPQDIPSVFLDYQTLKQNLGDNDPNYPGIPVNGGNFFIQDGIMLPETQSQEEFEIALLGTMAIMFGHQLGLPNLFNTNTGLPGIGVFGLMDQGSGNFSGLLPAEPCAWSKIFLGWEIPIEIKNGENLPVAAPQAANTNQIYKIPIDSKEYFLIENRNRDFNHDDIAVGRDAHGARIEFKWDLQGQRLVAEEVISVITQVDEYDFGLPGSGILIWHIDESVIEANFVANRVNADPDHRGVDLEEADGAQDIGQIYGFLDPGAGSENGVVEDMFWGSNEINMLVNDSSDVVAFTPFSKPNSGSNTGANSHIYINNFSEPDSVMTFSVREDFTQAGFPQFTGSSGIFTNSPIIADLDNDDQNEITLSSNTGTEIFVWKSDGSKFIENQDSTQIQKINDDIVTLPVAVFAKPPGSFSFSPAVTPFNDQNVVIAVTDQVVAAYLPEDRDFNGRADSLFVFQGSEEFTTTPLVITADAEIGQFKIMVGTRSGNIIVIESDGTGTVLGKVSSEAVTGLASLPPNRIAYTTKDGNLGLLSLDGISIWQNPTNTTISKAPVVGDLDSDGILNIVIVSDDGQIFVFEENSDNTPGFPKATNTNLSSQIALGDIDSDNFLEMVFVSKHKIFAFSHIGVLKNGFPIQISPYNVGGKNRPLLSSPILADLNNDRLPEILVGSDKNKLEAFHSTSEPVEGFPLSTGKSVNSTPMVSDIDNDGDLEVSVGSDDNFLYVWDLPGSYEPENIPWGGYLHDAQHTNANLELLQPDEPKGQLMPPNLVYNYPNPTEGNQTTIRYTLNFPAQVEIKIYDLAGELVDELTDVGFGQTENEIIWQLDNIESGVYLARVEAIGNGKKDVAIFKIAVVK